ncbi:hypothetical protein PVAP13_6NG095500 [Panicum virgatum]|uniref:Uncharacterized protein n=1 Tax=Panicum virgatum TaxID=38727 RepID=A0A8T0QX98_PANVG|nr:hypothetical protein PVAP13_6NG095500 [Panicum virgatum]
MLAGAARLRTMAKPRPWHATMTLAARHVGCARRWLLPSGQGGAREMEEGEVALGGIAGRGAAARVLHGRGGREGTTDDEECPGEDSVSGDSVGVAYHLEAFSALKL